MHVYRGYLIVREDANSPMKWLIYRVEYDRETRRNKFIYMCSAQTLTCAENAIDGMIMKGAW